MKRWSAWNLDVPLVQMNALMGFVATALTATILSLGLERDTETRTVLAFEKLLWIQNDFISRHYQAAVSPAQGHASDPLVVARLGSPAAIYASRRGNPICAGAYHSRGGFRQSAPWPVLSAD